MNNLWLKGFIKINCCTCPKEAILKFLMTHDERVHIYMTILVVHVGLMYGEYPSVLLWDYVKNKAKSKAKGFDYHTDKNNYVNVHYPPLS